jgi:hypothetical protein
MRSFHCAFIIVIFCTPIPIHSLLCTLHLDCRSAKKRRARGHYFGLFAVMHILLRDSVPLALARGQYIASHAQNSGPTRKRACGPLLGL